MEKIIMRSTRFKVVFMILVVMLVLAIIPGLLVQAEFGTNWTAQFFNSTDLTGSIVATASYASGINENWGTGRPYDGDGNELTAVDTDNFSARFVSVQTFVTGTYQFVAATDDGVRIYIDGVLVLDQFYARALTTDTFERDMTSGQHTVTLEYVEFTDSAVVQFQWFYLTSATATAVVPTSTPIVVTGQVVNARGLSLRTGPYLGASRIGVLKPDVTYSVSARNTDEGIYTWYLVTAGEQTGWASGRYLQLNADPSVLPLLATVFDEIDAAPDVGAVAIPRAYMHLRRRPSTRTASLDQVPWGEQVVLIGRTIQGGQLYWLQVRYNGQVGWIYAPYVTVRGEIDAVPIR